MSVNKTHNLKHENYSITIGWLYPRLMSTYGDRGNIIILKKRLEWRGIDVKVREIFPGEKKENIKKCDILFMGGAQDAQQEVVERDLFATTGKVICAMIEENTSALFVCGGYQFLGQYYMTANGKKIKGLGLLPLVTKNPGKGEKRLVGNVVLKPNFPELSKDVLVIGFENHGGRTYLSNESDAFAKVVKGHGNNGKDKTEGFVYKNAIGTYLHGPILSKSPELADDILEKTLVKKYKKNISLSEIDDSLIYKTRNELVKKWY